MTSLLKDGATGPFNIELFTGSPDDNNAKYFFKGAWDLLQPYFEKGVLVSPSQHGQGGVTKDFTVEDWQKISVMSWKTEQAQKDMESILTPPTPTARSSTRSSLRTTASPRV